MAIGNFFSQSSKMLKSSLIRAINSNTFNNAISSVNSQVPKVGNYFLSKLTNLNEFYTKLLGLDEVKVYQNRVVNLQEKLLEAQDRRREIGRNLSEIRAKSNRLQDEIHKVKRQENLQKFLDLMREETEILKTESEIVQTFQDCDRTERELFSAFTNAVRDSHEKQRAQVEYTKYFGIVLSIIGSFLTFSYSTLKKSDLKHFIEDTINRGIEKHSVQFNSRPPIENNRPPEVIKVDLKEEIEEIQRLEQHRTRFYQIVCYSLLVLIALKAISSHT